MMRTYTRKRPHHQLIEDVHELCRLCLNKAVEAMPIFTDDTNNICATLALRIMICVGLEMKKEECLPNIICTKCYNELNKYYAFRKNCETTYQKLKSHVLAFQENLYKQKIMIEAEKKKKIDEDNENRLKFVGTFVKDQFPEVNVINLNGVGQLNHYVDQLPDLTKVDRKAPEIKIIHENEHLHLVQNENEHQPNEQQLQDGDTYSPDITTFLSTMLIELGILTQNEDGLVYSNQNIKSLELETGDGSQIRLELVEEDDVEEQVKAEVKEEPQNTPKNVNETSQGDECVIKYGTANRRGRPKKLDKKGGAWCSVCGKRLATSSALTRHMRVHSGERPYACATCQRSFAQREVMLRHLLVHEEDRPHKCTHCDKSFTQRGALVSHARAHAPPNARPLALHRCDRCPKVFLYASGLSRHMMMHNGRVYVCGACERQFKDKSSLLRHLKNANHTPGEDSPT